MIVTPDVSSQLVRTPGRSPDVSMMQTSIADLEGTSVPRRFEGAPLYSVPSIGRPPGGVAAALDVRLDTVRGEDGTEDFRR